MVETDLLKRTQALIIVAILIAIISLIASFTKNVITERWAKSRDKVACIPANVDFHYPMVYHQTAANPIQSDTLIKSFIEEYIHLTQDEQIVDYHNVTQNSRYKNARLNKARWRAVNLSSYSEKVLNMKRYNESNDVFYTLKQGNMGWVFLIDDILVYPSQKNGVTLAVVRGEFQITYDRVKVDLPSKLWGYREIHLMINEGVPVQDTKNAYINKYGLFVSWSDMISLNPDQKDLRTKRASDYYLKEENL